MKGNTKTQLACCQTFNSFRPRLQKWKNWNTQKENRPSLAENDVIWVSTADTSHGCPVLFLVVCISVQEIQEFRVRRERLRRNGEERVIGWRVERTLHCKAHGFSSIWVIKQALQKTQTRFLPVALSFIFRISFFGCFHFKDLNALFHFWAMFVCKKKYV